MLTVRPVESKAEMKAFIELPYEAYRGDPHWRAPLRFERKDHFNPKKNHSLNSLKPEYFLAFRGNKPVGRVAAFVNPDQAPQNKENTGHFGCLLTLQPNDAETVQALMSAAEAYLKAKGMEHIQGPFNFSVNEECGLLVEGFETPPYILMPHGRPDMPQHLESLGYVKAMDMYAYKFKLEDEYVQASIVPPMQKYFDSNPSMALRCLDPKNFDEDIAIIVDIFNDAWADNWGFVPFTSIEAKRLAKSIKPIISPDSLWMTLIDGEPVSFTLMLPNINEAAEGLDGRLFPFGWMQFLHRLKIAGVKSSRVPLAGTRRAYHKSRKGMAATSIAWDRCVRAQHAKGVREVEISWVLETNKDLIGLTKLFECDRHKTYRIYEKPI